MNGAAEALEPPAAATLRGALLSPSWYRVAALVPRLVPQARWARHRYRGSTWFVLSDGTRGRSHRLSPAARFVVAGMDGTRSVQQLWALADAQLGERAPTQDELIQLLAQLHAADLLLCDLNPDAAELFERGRRQRRQQAWQRFGNPVSIRIPLFDPDRLLERLWIWLRPLWNRWGLALWLAVVLPALVLAAMQARELTHNLADRAMAPANLLALVLLFPLLKVLHELGHGLAVKARGGEVHEVGLMLLVLMPVPYVDATASSAFPDKRDRALVAAAGMAVELFVAALALYFWLLAEPGLARSLAFNTLLLAGVTTLLFNGNPLLRYDAYYILADLIEMPNLATRANRHVGTRLAQRLFGARDLQGEAVHGRERAWLVGYAVASFAYRVWITIVIVWFIAAQFFVIGVLLALWAVVTMAVLPLVRTLRLMFAHPALQPVQGRVRWVSGGAAVALVLLLAGLPWPQASYSEGVAWLPEQALLRAGADGFLVRWVVPPGTRVRHGDVVAEHRDPALAAQREAAAARLAELEAQLAAHWTRHPVEAALTRQAMQREQAALALIEQRQAGLLTLAGSDGVFVAERAADAEGRFHHQGELLGHVVGDAATRAPAVVRAFVPQEHIDLVRSGTLRVEVRLAHAAGELLAARIVREVPAGQDRLPSAALAPAGGGTVAVDPRDAQGLKTLQRGFQFDIELAPRDGQPVRSFFGERAHLRFVHAAEPLAWQWARRVRQLFLGRLHA